MFFRRTALSLLLLLPLSTAAMADSIATAGTDMAVALPVLAGGFAIYKDDWTGVVQLGVSTAASVGTAYGLKHVIREERPNHEDNQSFPSDTTALAASGASFLWARYGWTYGLPAFAVTGFVAYSRVESGAHRWYDTLAGAGISTGYAFIFDSPYREPRRFYSSLSATPDSAYLRVGYNF
jgi:membrane-associated phospholipid phosphatase